MNCLKIVFLTLITVSGFVECAQYARKGAAMLGTAAYVGFSCSAALMEGYFYYNRNKFEREMEQLPLSASHPLVNAFTKNELESLDLPNVRVMPAHNTFACNKHIAIIDYEMNSVERALARIQAAESNGLRPDLYDIEIRNRFKGTLHHEANHILHKDTSIRGLLLAVASSCAPIGARAVVRTMRIASNAKKLPNVRKAIAGIFNGALSLELSLAGHRLIEQQADDGVQDVDAMKGMLSAADDMVKDMEWAREDFPAWKIFVAEHLLTHPSPASRLAKLQSRLQEQDAQEN